MRHIHVTALTLVLLTLANVIGAQPIQPVHWSANAVQVEGDIYEISATGRIDGNWHIYDLTDYGGKGPYGTVFKISGGNATPVGEPYISSPVTKAYDETFGMEIGSCKSPVVICQKVELQDGPATPVAVFIEWQACNNANCLSPEDCTLEVTLPAKEGAAELKADETDNDSSGKGGLWAMIIEALLWGFAALLTPCVFPMVPMTVSFFMKGSEDKSRGRFRALMYGLFIVLLYTVPIAVIILTTRIIGGEAVTADIFNWLATHWLPNIIFFIVFMVFAASFFGAFEIVLPSHLVNGSDKKSDRGGLGGIFFLALTLVLVSFSCTGPIVGTVLIKATSGEFWAPIVAMLVFSFAFALPFVLFALFPSLLKNLPKSGGWLNSVKVVLGFIEVALGFKFLSTADQVYHWGLLDREVYLAIWIVVFSLLGFYLLGKLKFKYDSDLPYIGVTRLTLAIVCFSFVVYMIPGMWGAPLKALSGYLPPIETQDFVIDTETGWMPRESNKVDNGDVKYGDFLSLPHNLDGFFDLSQAQEYAACVNKPLFIAFTGHGCVNCREMEARVWSDPRVLDLLRNKFVICALYADDKKQVDRGDWVTTEDGKVLKTLGKINSYFALKQYGVNAQPYYVIQDANGNSLTEPRGYNLDVEQFVEWLKKGLNE